MRLVELEPRWVGAGGEGVYQADGSPAPKREGIGVSFACPCGKREPIGDEPDDDSHRCFIPFANPIDGLGPFYADGEHPTWRRTGDDFETLTLEPSILRVGGCGWHGFVTNGEIRTCSL